MARRPESDRFRTLPRPVRLEETVTSLDVGPVQDPQRGHDTELDFLIRHCVG